MQSNHQPVSTLPWSTGSIDKVIRDSTKEHLADTAAIADAAYIVHSANAYPKMVMWLRNVAEVLEQHKAIGTASDVRALLRDLGESS